MRRFSTPALRMPVLCAPLLALALGAAGTAQAQAQDTMIGPIRISHPWAPPTPESAREAAGYLTITNTGSAPDRLVSGSFAESVDLSLHAAGKGAKMAPVDGFTVNPGETVTLVPGGSHLMFSDLRSPLKAGMSVQSILRFERAGTGVVEFAIEGKAPHAPGHHGHSAHAH